MDFANCFVLHPGGHQVAEAAADAEAAGAIFEVAGVDLRALQ
jgi:hypothetical protein